MLVALDGHGTPFELPVAAEEALFRIAREALINCAKYSGATRASVCLNRGARTIRLAITDAGRGFELAVSHPTDHVGLALVFMHEAVGADPVSPLASLSKREHQILQLIADGTSSAEAAALLFLSPKTVETYRSRLMHKLGVANYSALVKFAIANGLTTN